MMPLDDPSDDEDGVALHVAVARGHLESIKSEDSSVEKYPLYEGIHTITHPASFSY